mgnify:CR=1 FL=1
MIRALAGAGLAGCAERGVALGAAYAAGRKSRRQYGGINGFWENEQWQLNFV